MIFSLFFLLAAQEMTAPQISPPSPATQNSPALRRTPSSISIDAKSRSEDIVKAFELLKKEKPTFRISVRTVNGETINNISEIISMPNGTLLLLRTSTPQGAKVHTLPVDELQELFYS